MTVNEFEKISEYKSKTLSLNVDTDLPYLKKDCFRTNSENPPYTVLKLEGNNVLIKNTSYSGIIQLEETRLHFSEKVNLHLFYMMSFLKDEDYFYYDPDVIIEIKEGANFFDILGRLFLNEIEKIERKGFYKKYVRKEENLKYFKGKLLVKKQTYNSLRKLPKFFCSYDDLTYDNLENQIMLKAANLLIPLIRFNAEVKSELFRYSNILKESISLVNVVPEDCNRIQYSRLNEHYKPIIQLSKVILQNYFIRSKFKGAAKGFNFIVNMNKVYEDFIETIMFELIEEEDDFKKYKVESQKRFTSLVKEEKIGSRPDIVLRLKDQPNNYPYIIDAKYKKDPNNSDFYQIIAYSLEIPDAKAACLIYPIYEKEIKEDVYTLNTQSFGNKRGEIKLHTFKIDLFLDENLSFNEYIFRVKEEVKKKLLKFIRN